MRRLTKSVLLHCAILPNRISCWNNTRSTRVLLSANVRTTLLPGIIHQLGPDSLMNLKRIAGNFTAGSNKPGDAADDHIHNIGEKFEDVSNK